MATRGTMKTFMRRALGSPLRTAFLFMLLALAMLVPGVARADSRTAFLAERLKADDFRVRANAALALGATDDDAAVQPLCGALSDGNEVVRSSAAAALKRLGKGAGLGCVKARLAIETADSVKLQLTRAVETLQTAPQAVGTSTQSVGAVPPDAPPKLIPGAKMYVSVAPITNNTGRPQPEIERVVGGAVRAKLEELGIQVAPKVETPDAARKVMADRHMSKGFYLSVVVKPFNTSSGIGVAMDMSIATYPGRGIIATVPGSASSGSAKAGDHGTEDGLMTAVAQSLVVTFNKNAPDL